MALDLKKYRKQLIEERDRLTEQIPTVAEAAEPTPDDRQITAANAAAVKGVTSGEGPDAATPALQFADPVADEA